MSRAPLSCSGAASGDGTVRPGAATLDYYERCAEEFVAQTLHADMSALHEAFLARVAPGGRILDLGCGSGRDSKAFLAWGYEVVAVDGAQALCERAAAYLGQEVVCARFEDYEPEGTFDGIWACASLLHLTAPEIVQVLRKLAPHLSSDGWLYASFKYGSASGERGGRYFTDFTEDRLRVLLAQVPELHLAATSITQDTRHRSQPWLNAYLVR